MSFKGHPKDIPSREARVIGLYGLLPMAKTVETPAKKVAPQAVWRDADGTNTAGPVNRRPSLQGAVL